MPRYVVERTFAEGLRVAIDSIVARNADEGVTWLQSYVNDSDTKTFCVYDAPNPEAIRKTALRNGLPVDCITQVRVLDPYRYS